MKSSASEFFKKQEKLCTAIDFCKSVGVGLREKNTNKIYLDGPSNMYCLYCRETNSFVNPTCCDDMVKL